MSAEGESVTIDPVSGVVTHRIGCPDCNGNGVVEHMGCRFGTCPRFCESPCVDREVECEACGGSKEIEDSDCSCELCFAAYDGWVERQAC